MSLTLKCDIDLEVAHNNKDSAHCPVEVELILKKNPLIRNGFIEWTRWRLMDEWADYCNKANTIYPTSHIVCVSNTLNG